MFLSGVTVRAFSQLGQIQFSMGSIPRAGRSPASQREACVTQDRYVGLTVEKRVQRVEGTRVVAAEAERRGRVAADVDAWVVERLLGRQCRKIDRGLQRREFAVLTAERVQRHAADARSGIVEKPAKRLGAAIVAEVVQRVSAHVAHRGSRMLKPLEQRVLECGAVAAFDEPLADGEPGPAWQAA